MNKEELIEFGNDAVAKALKDAFIIANSDGHILSKGRDMDKMIFSPKFDCLKDRSIMLFDTEDDARRAMEDILAPQADSDEHFGSIKITHIIPSDGEETINVETDGDLFDIDSIIGSDKDDITEENDDKTDKNNEKELTSDFKIDYVLNSDKEEVRQMRGKTTDMREKMFIDMAKDVLKSFKNIDEITRDDNCIYIYITDGIDKDEITTILSILADDMKFGKVSYYDSEPTDIDADKHVGYFAISSCPREEVTEKNMNENDNSYVTESQIRDASPYFKQFVDAAGSVASAVGNALGEVSGVLQVAHEANHAIDAATNASHGAVNDSNAIIDNIMAAENADPSQSIITLSDHKSKVLEAYNLVASIMGCLSTANNMAGKLANLASRQFM